MSRFPQINRRTILALSAAVAATGVPVRALTIVPTFDTTITSLSNASTVEAAIDYADEQYEELYSNPITVNIDFQATTGASYLGDTFATYGTNIAYSTIRSAFDSDAASHGQSDQMTAAADNWPATDPTGSGSDWYVPTAEQKALGLLSATNSASDAKIIFNFNNASGFGPFTYTYDPYDRGVTSGTTFDFIGVAEHEIAHALGRDAMLGAADSINKPSYSPLDLYYFDGPGSLGLNSTSGDYFSINDGQTNLKNFASGMTDNSDWANNGPNGYVPDSFNAASNNGIANTLTPVDLTVMDVLGYDIQPSVLQWNGGSADFLTGNNWSTATQGAINPHNDATLLQFSGTASHNFTSGENLTLGSSSDMAKVVEVVGGTFEIGVSGKATTSGFGILVNQDGQVVVNVSGVLDVAGPLSIGDTSFVTNASAGFGNNSIVNVGTASGTTQIFYVGNQGTGTVTQTQSAAVNTPELDLGGASTGDGSYSLENSAVLTVSGNENVGENGIGTFNQSGGANAVNGAGLRVGDLGGSNGSYTLSSGTLTVQGGEAIGYSGSGLFTQTEGTHSILGPGLFLGYNSGGSGTLNLSGGTLSVTNNVYVGGSDLYGAGGSGSLNVSSGGALTVGGTLTIFNVGGNIVNLPSGTITTAAINDEGNPALLNWTGGTLHITTELDLTTGTDPFNAHPFNASLSIGSNLANVSQTLQVDGFEWLNGSGSTLNQNPGGTNTTPYLYIGSSGTPATYNLNAADIEVTTAAGTLTSSYEYIGFVGTSNVGGAGAFNQSGGTNNVNGGALYLGYDTGQTGNYLLDTSGVLNAENGAQEDIGEYGNGIFNQTGGTNTLNSGSLLDLGVNAGATGTYTLSSGTVMSSGANEIVGDSGVGIFNQTGGTNTFSSFNSVTIGNAAGSNGTYNLSGGLLSVFEVIVGGSGKGTFTLSDTGQLQTNTLSVGSNGQANLNTGTTTVGILQINSGGVVNVNAALIDDYFGRGDPAATIRSEIISGYNGGAWNGPGINSSLAAASGGKYAVGYADGSVDTGTTAAANDVLIQLTLVGDANLDGTVNLTDLLLLLNNYGQSDRDWSEGDFNYDGTVNLTDLLGLLNNYGQMAVVANTSIGGINTVPEPEIAGVIGFGCLLLRRKSRPKRRGSHQHG